MTDKGVSLSVLVERERLEHAAEHEQERTAAKETALRLEREVEQTALRLERVVEETAIRLEKGVVIALAAVGETARVHSDAHTREHQSHERIHAVEKSQVEKAEGEREKEAARLSASLQEYKEQSNEWRGALRDAANNYISRDVFDHERDRINSLEKIIIGREVFDRLADDVKTVDRRVDLQVGAYVSRELFDKEHERLLAIEKKLAYYAGMGAVGGAALALILRLLNVGV